MIRLTNILFSYPRGAFSLSIPEWSLQEGGKLAVTGESGSGKSTFLHLIAGILLPASGEVRINDLVLSEYSYADRQDFRLVKMGLVFQEFELLDYLSLSDNVLIPFRTSPLLSLTTEVEDRARGLLDTVGLGSKINRKPSELSQGERQRVAVCRALVTQPAILLCDEPTGNLDTRNRDLVVKTLLDYSGSAKATLVVVTHDPGMVPLMDSHLDIADFSV